MARALVALCVVALLGCGGGGDPLPSTRTGNFQAVFAENGVEATGVEGTPAEVTVEAMLSVTGEATNGVYLSADADEAIVLDIRGFVAGDVLMLTLTLRGDLAPGDHSGELTLHACYDEACSRSPTGSPVRVPIRYRVLPNIQAQREVTLSRQGREPAPDVVIPVTVPVEAGRVDMQVTNHRPDAMALSFDGSALRVVTQQVRAGQYRATATLRSTSDERYSRTVDVTYTVTAPPGGERALSIADSYRTLSYQQGQGSVQHFVVTRPTWTHVWDEPQLYGNSHGLVTLTPSPDGNYDVIVNTANVPPGYYQPSIRFSAGPTGGTEFAQFNISVQQSFYIDGALQRTLTATSTASDLEWSNPVVTFDGVPARWTAVSQSPLLQIVGSTGITGSDPLRLRLDASAIGLPDWLHSLPISISIDRPGTLPQTVQFSVSNLIPTLHTASPSTLVGGSGRVYIEGNFRQYQGDPLASNRLRVEGATLVRGRLAADLRYIGDVVVLELDLTGATPGRPVKVSVDSELRPSQVELQVQAPVRATTAYQPLAYGIYRPGQFSPGLGAFYFAKPGTVYRWAPDAGAWSLSHRDVPGLIDVAPSPDESRVYAITSSQVLALQPQTLAQQSAGNFTDWWQTSPMSFDATAGNTRALSFSADGRALASLFDASAVPPYNVGTVCVMPSSRAVSLLTDGPRSCDPGSAKGWAWGAASSGTVRSASGSIVVGFNTEGRRSSYRADERQWVSNAPLPSGLTVSAVSDTGARLVRSDGMLINAEGTAFGNLGGVVPFTHLVGGYALSSGGRFGLVYGYQISGAGSAQRATDATLWVIDLNNAAWSGVGSAPIVAALPLPNAVGCTSAPVAGEACQHQASIHVAPGDGTAFVVGPRGVAVIALPNGVTSAQPMTAGRERARVATGPAASSPAAPWRSRGRVIPR